LAGTNVKVAGDDTLYSMKEGKVKFTSKKKIRFDGNTRRVAVVSVVAKP
jgi:ribosomal protein L27